MKKTLKRCMFILFVIALCLVGCAQAASQPESSVSDVPVAANLPPVTPPSPPVRMETEQAREARYSLNEALVVAAPPTEQAPEYVRVDTVEFLENQTDEALLPQGAMQAGRKLIKQDPAYMAVWSLWEQGYEEENWQERLDEQGDLGCAR